MKSLKHTLIIDLFKQRAEAAAELAPGLIQQPGGQIVRGLIPTPYGFSPEVAAGPAYLPGELTGFEELFDACSEPEKVNKNLLLILAGSMGAGRILPTDPTTITNTEICQRLIRYAEVTRTGREPISPQVRSPV